MKSRIDDEITFRKLEIFLAFLQTGNLSKAAEILDSSPVSVHRALHSLEEGLRCQLFRNEGRNLQPTPAAFAFAESAREVVEQMVRGISQARAVAGFSSDHIRIGSLYSLTSHVVPQVIMEIKLRRPNLRVELVLGSNDDLQEKLRSSQIDAALLGLTPQDPQQIQTIPLFEDGIFLAVPAEAPAELFESEADLEKLKDADFVSLTGGSVTHHGFVEAFKVAGFNPKVVTRVGDVYSLMSLVAGGVGYTLLPGRVRDVLGDRVKLIPLQARFRVPQTVGLAFLLARERDPNILALAAVCRLGGPLWGRFTA